MQVHPAKKGWNGCYRTNPELQPVHVNEGARAINVDKGPNLLLQFDGFMNASVYTSAFQHVARTYFVNPNYYRVPTKLANGTVADCAYFAMYQMEYFTEAVGGATKVMRNVTAANHSLEFLNTTREGIFFSRYFCCMSATVRPAPCVHALVSLAKSC